MWRPPSLHTTMIPGLELPVAWAGTSMSLRHCGHCPLPDWGKLWGSFCWVTAFCDFRGNAGQLMWLFLSQALRAKASFCQGWEGWTGWDGNIWWHSNCYTSARGRLHSLCEEGVTFQWHSHRQERHCCKPPRLLNYFAMLSAHLISGCFCISAAVVVTSIVTTL